MAAENIGCHLQNKDLFLFRRIGYSVTGREVTMRTRNCSRTVESLVESSPSAMQSAFFCWLAFSVTTPATALFSRTASVISTLPSKFTSPYRD